MTCPIDHVSSRLTALGWAIRHVVEPALEVEGRPMPVVTVKATRELLRARVVSTRSGRPWEHRVDVVDNGAAKEVLEQLSGHLPAGGEGVAGLASRLAQLGWEVDRERSRETAIDEPGWELYASRAGARLELGVKLGGVGPRELSVLDLDFVTLRETGFEIFATVHFDAEAERLVAALGATAPP
ncbi:MAG: hypothetical protein JNK82_03920 [Myxococcaceae bacterium]|nr:hypothetical protein [Myxococcaceae bacterium]